MRLEPLENISRRLARAGSQHSKLRAPVSAALEQGSVQVRLPQLPEMVHRWVLSTFRSISAGSEVQFYICIVFRDSMTIASTAQPPGSIGGLSFIELCPLNSVARLTVFKKPWCYPLLMLEFTKRAGWIRVAGRIIV